LTTSNFRVTENLLLDLLFILFILTALPVEYFKILQQSLEFDKRKILYARKLHIFS